MLNHVVTFNFGSAKVWLPAIFKTYLSCHKGVWIAVIVSPKIGAIMDHAQSSSASVYTSAEISYIQCTSHILLGIYFKLCKWLSVAEIWPPHSFGSPGVEIILWGGGGSKTCKILASICVQAKGHSFFQIYFIFGT